jgi:RNA polymerase sigma-70 factor (ECF subfamily)
VTNLSEATFVEYLKLCEGRLYRIAWAIVGQGDAGDMLQEAVTQAWRNRGAFHGDAAAFAAWMRRITANCCIDLLRRRQRVTPLDPRLLPEPEPLPPLDARSDNHALWEAVRTLDPEHRQVLALRYLGDLSLETIANRLDLPVGTVKSRISRALIRLRPAVSATDRPTAQSAANQGGAVCDGHDA